ncbi:MAG: hypothetical protein IJA60_02500 [Clostridia bacterium]|nr:hypothetical protein [Clostridia bacterium]
MKTKITTRLVSFLIFFALVLSILPTAYASETFNESYSLTDGLQVWYKFDETSGDIAKDSSGNGHDATVYGAKWITTADNQGVALELDNTDTTGKYVDIPTAVMNNVTGDFTVSTWVKVKDGEGVSRVFDYGTSASNVMFLTAGKYILKMDNSSSKRILPPESLKKSDTKDFPLGYMYPVEFSAPRWQHITVTRKGNLTTLWINGIRWASGEFETVNPRTGDGYKFYIGKSNWAADPYASLEVKDFRVYSRSLSINEINAVMESGWTDEILVHHAIDSINLPDFANVTENLYLPTIVNDMVKVEWSSDSPAIETSGYIGTVHRPKAGEETAKAKLTAEFSYGKYSKSVTYNAVVLPKDTEDTSYTLTVDTKDVLHSMSPTMYGAFFEDISHAGDGGLYPELLRNSSFHDATDSIPYWHLYTVGGAVGTISLDQTNNLNAAQFQHLKFDISEMPSGGCVGICNEGYFGMEFEAGSNYNLTFYARTDDFSGKISAQLLSATGEEISAPATLSSITSEWTKYSLTLTPSEYAAQGQMVLYCEGDTGTVHIDAVSLMPETVYGASGLRVDMAESIEAMNPTFLRFPGGCYIEGKNFSQSFYWKNTLYDKEERSGHENIWGYRSTDGLGYYEFLLLCEDLGVEPLYVCGIGITHGPNEDWTYWVDEVMDAIEFANGDTNTEWGKVRAEMGHPEPFNMKYIEIGNEANMQLERYEERYQDFYDAIKAKYPYMNLIANCDMDGKSIDIVDKHYYDTPEWFADNGYLFDGYRKDDYKVYVGEYATAVAQGLQNLSAAIGEAAFMVGMERNSDVVTMTSYAPLFANPNRMNWSMGASFFDSSRLYASPSYYVQSMFANNLGDDVLNAKLGSTDGLYDGANVICGSVGLCTWNTNVTYSDIKVTSNIDGKVLFDGSGTTASDWISSKGTWTVENGNLTQTDIASDCRIWVDGKNFTDYTYEVTARKNDGNEAFVILVGVEDTDNVFFVNLGGWSNTKSTIQRIKNGVKASVTNTVNGSFESNRDYKIKVVVSQNNMTVYVDGELMFDYTQNDAADCPLNYVAQKDNTTGDIIIKAVNTSDNDFIANINILGATDIGTEAETTILTSASKYDENSFENPENVAPVTIPVTNVSDNFEYTFMRNSVTVLVIPTGDTVANKTTLSKMVDDEKAEALNKDNFTEKTWSAYETALANAEAILKIDTATQEEVNNVAKALSGSKALLQKKNTAAEGDETLAIKIDTAEKLIELMNNSAAWGEKYEITADINLAGLAQTPIGNATTPFTGTIDGSGKTIKGITLSGAGNIGFFGIAGDCTIKNLTLEGTVTSTADNAGGFIGKLVGDAVIDNCVNKVVVSGTNNVGGFIGHAPEETDASLTVTNSVNEVGVTGSGARVGGFVGFVKSTLSAKNFVFDACINKGNISGTQMAGGLVGRFETGAGNTGADHKFINSANYGNIESTTSNYTGGIVGLFTFNSGGTSGYAFDNLYNCGNITAKAKYNGGIVGYFRSYTDGVGGFYNCMNSGTVYSSVTGNAYNGGIIGVGNDISATVKYEIENIYNAGFVSSVGGGLVGPIAGTYHKVSGTITPENCYYLDLGETYSYTVNETKVTTDNYASAETFTGFTAEYWTFTAKGPELKTFHVHTEEIIPAVAPTYTSTGLTEGIKCSVCGEILVAQKEIPMLEGDIPGDINGDYIVTVADALALIRVVVNNQNVENGDLNGDGKISLIDVIRLMKLVAN